MRTDLPHIEDALQWAWSEAWDIPTQPAPEHGRIHPGVSFDDQARLDRDDCYVPALKWDLGIGNDKARSAIANAGPRLTGCDHALDNACLLARREDDNRYLPFRLDAGRGAHLRELIALTININWRLNYVNDRVARLPLPRGKAVLREISQANRKLLATRGPLDRAMRTGKQTVAAPDPEDLCIICNRRPRLRDGKRCPTCRNWKHRHGGEERPAELDAA